MPNMVPLWGLSGYISDLTQKKISLDGFFANNMMRSFVIP